MDEQYLLLQMLSSDGIVRESERNLISQLSSEVKNVSPQLRKLCETAMSCEEHPWCVGGKIRGGP